MSKKQYDYLHGTVNNALDDQHDIAMDYRRTKRVLRRLVREAVMKSLEFDMMPFAEREEEAHRIAKSLVP